MLLNLISLAIVDDHVLFRKTLKSYLTEQENMQVVVQASDIMELMDKMRSRSVDVVVMDLFMQGLSSTEAVKALRAENPEVRILALSMSNDMDLISDLLDSGIHGYISKSDDPEDLVAAIRAAACGQIYRNRIFTEALYRNKQNNIKMYSDRSPQVLNEREKKILQLLWEEKSNKEIADQLFLGIRSIEKLRQDLKEKIGAKSTVGLLKYGIDKKIIRVNSPSHLI